MRNLILAALAFAAVGTATVIDTTEANAVVCARGVYRAGCAGYRGGVVVRRPFVAPVAACRWIWVNGVRVRRCV